jgi:hypothetical protein
MILGLPKVGINEMLLNAVRMPDGVSCRDSLMMYVRLAWLGQIHRRHSINNIPSSTHAHIQHHLHADRMNTNLILLSYYSVGQHE